MAILPCSLKGLFFLYEVIILEFDRVALDHNRVSSIKHGFVISLTSEKHMIFTIQKRHFNSHEISDL